MDNCNISVVIPEYKGEKMVRELVERIQQSLGIITENYEIILVNDCSPDNTWTEIKKACELDRRVKGINLSRNFGQHYAITAGLHYAKGDWIVVMDCDLQDRPEEIPRIYSKAQDGWDIVQTRRVKKQCGFLKRMSSVLFHKVYDWMSGLNTDSSISNFGIYSHKVIAEYNKIGEVSRSFGSLIRHLGFKTTVIDVQHSIRREGKSSYNLSKLLKLSFDIIISNSNKPLRLAVLWGLVMSGISFLLASYNLIAKLMGEIGVSGYTSTIFSIWFVGGLLLMMMGILGLYIGKIFDQVKGRPIYVVAETLNVD